MVEKAISYLDKVSVESLPILPVGACVLSGVIADLPVIVQVGELPSECQPQSENVDLDEHWGTAEFNTQNYCKEYDAGNKFKVGNGSMPLPCGNMDSTIGRIVHVYRDI